MSHDDAKCVYAAQLRLNFGRTMRLAGAGGSDETEITRPTTHKITLVWLYPKLETNLAELTHGLSSIATSES